MLKGIASCISPDLLKVLGEMGHGDEIVLADAHFPAHSMNARVLRADGVPIITFCQSTELVSARTALPTTGCPVPPRATSVTVPAWMVTVVP